MYMNMYWMNSLLLLLLLLVEHWHIGHFYFVIFLYVFYAVRIGYAFGCHYYPMNLNSLGHCICVHQGKISAAAGLEPGTLRLWVDHATNELSWRHGVRKGVHTNEQNHVILIF